MNISYLSASVFPSTAANTINTMKTCKAMAEAGHKVTLWVPGKRTDNVENIFAFYGMTRCFHISFLPYPAFPGGALIYAFLQGLMAKRSGAEVVYGRFVPGCFFSQLFGISTVLETHKPFTAHEKIREFFFGRLVRGRNFVRHVVISYALERYFLSRYPLVSGRTVVAHNAADIPAAALRKIDLPGRNSLKIGYVGHLYPGKGGELLSKIIPECPWADFHLVGGNPRNIDHWREKMASCHNAFFHGFIPPAETEDYRQSFDVLLAPYLSQVAGADDRDLCQDMPLKVFEYMASARPIVATDLPVLREVLTHDANALLCREHVVEDWINALVALRDHPELRRRLSSAAYDDFLAKYTWEQRARLVLQGLSA